MRSLFFLALACGASQCQSLNCDLREYKPVDGLTAQVAAGGLARKGGRERGKELRAGFWVRRAQPPSHGLAVPSGQRKWRKLGNELSPRVYLNPGPRGNFGA